MKLAENPLVVLVLCAEKESSTKFTTRLTILSNKVLANEYQTPQAARSSRAGKNDMQLQLPTSAKISIDFDQA